MADFNSFEPIDRSLPLRTALTALFFVAFAYPCVHFIAEITGAQFLTDYHDTLRTVWADGQVKALWLKLGDIKNQQFHSLYLAFATFLLGLVFALIFQNRMLLQRRIFSFKGIIRLMLLAVLCFLILPFVITVIEHLPLTRIISLSSFSVSPLVIFDPKFIWILPANVVLFYLFWGELTLGRTFASNAADNSLVKAIFLSILAGVVAGLALNALLAAWCAFVAPKLILLTKGYTGFLSKMTVPGFLGWTWYHLGICLAILPALASLVSLVVAFSPSPTQVATRITAILIALLPALILSGITIWFNHYCNASADMRYTGLSDAAALEVALTRRVIVLPTRKGFLPFNEPIEMETTQQDRISHTRRNIEFLSGYFKEKNDRWTAYTASAWQARALIMDGLHEPALALAYYVEAAEKANDFSAASIALERALISPLKPDLRSAIEALDDERIFVAERKSRAQQARLVARFGDISYAQKLWNKALKEGYIPADGEQEPTGTSFSAGRLTGRVLMNDIATPGVRALLYWGPEPIDYPITQMSIRPLAAVDTDGNGNFQFDGLVAGFYRLGFLLPETVTSPNDIRIMGRIGPYPITEKESSLDIGRLRIQK